MGCGVVGVLWWVSVVREWVAGFNTVFVWVGVGVTWCVEWVWAWLIFFFPCCGLWLWWWWLWLVPEVCSGCDCCLL